MKKLIIIALGSLSLLQYSCSSAGFGGGTGPKPATPEIAPEDNEAPEAPKEMEPDSDGDSQTAADSKCTEQSTSTADIVFAIDVSTTMGGDVDTAKRNVTAMAQNFENARKIKPTFGLVEYHDDIYQAKMFNSVKSFDSALAGVKAEIFKWTDMVEAGLTALKTGQKVLAKSKADVKAIVLITDAFSHDGGNNNNRNCELSGIVDGWDKDILLYISHPKGNNDSHNQGCSKDGIKFENISAQYNQLAKDMKEKHDRNIVTSLGWPVSDKTFLETLPDKIEKCGAANLK